MNKITTQLGLFLIGFCILVCVACQPTSSTITLFTLTPSQNAPVTTMPTPKVVISLTPTPTMALLPTIQFIPTEPTAPLTPLPTNTLPPLPTLSPEEAMAEVQRLYETNNDCLLPCWWGIVPGQTDWITAKRFFESFSQITEPFAPPTEPLWGVYIYLPTKEISAPHHYRIYGDIIIEMEGYIQMTPLFDPTTILATYGPPSEVRVAGGDNLFFFYPEQGFLLQYELTDANGVTNENREVINGVLHSCFVKPTTYLVVWSPADTFTFSERLEQTTHFNYYEDVPGLPLEEATGMTIDTFYQTFQNAEPPLCLDTPESLWPGQ